MLSFQDAVFPLLVLGFIIVAGSLPTFQLTDFRNTGFPLLLRFTVWTLYKLTPPGSRKETYAFLLDHPRRCFTLLFPRSTTWWLFLVLFIMNFFDLFFFLILDLGNDYVDATPVGYRILDGLFQVFLRDCVADKGDFDKNGRGRSGQSDVNKSGVVGELFGYDVHLDLPGRDEYSEYQRLRRKEYRLVFRRG